jgi:glycerate 2-kinase
VAPASATRDTPMLPGFSYFFSGHPLPDAESLHAGGAILKTLRADYPESFVIYLLSGGGSAMVEKPVSDDISLDDLILTYRALVNCGAPIAEINAIRKHLSAVKGGRMAQAAGQGGATQQASIMVSDVPDSALDALASGPTMPDSSTVEDCYRIARDYDLQKLFPPSVRSLFAERLLEETPKQDDGIFARARWWPVLSSAELQRAAAAAASRAGFAVEVDNSCDDWDFARAGDYLLQRLSQLRQGVSRACLISGGEVTVRVPPQAGGIGGRNQHFALYCAEKIAGQNVCVLSAGSDGIDGNSAAAGAIADGNTTQRAQSEGFNAAATLAGFNAYALFDRLGDTIMSGPTGNNIRDLRILLAY